MKSYVHARLGPGDRALLDELKAATGKSDSELVRRGLQLVAGERKRQRSALDLAGPAVGKFARGPRDLSQNAQHLEGFGE